MNSKRVNQTATAAMIGSRTIVIGKMHFRVHKDTWYKQNCNPYKLFADLKEIYVICLYSQISAINRLIRKFVSKNSLGCHIMLILLNIWTCTHFFAYLLHLYYVILISIQSKN